MKRTAILGAFFGDEGKGAITHALSPQYDWIIRTSGGSNAGHTIYRDGKKYVHNLLPSVDYRKKSIKSFLGSGMVIDLLKLEEEITSAETYFPGIGETIYVDKDAFLVLEKHKEEDKATNAHIGSTNRGIGPAYKDKVARSGMRINDLMRKDSKLEIWHEPYINAIFSMTMKGVKFTNSLTLKKEFEESNILFEGAQGVMLDINHGTYPYVSCGDCTIAGIAGSGFAYCMPDKIYGVSKVYSTRVGEGPFPTELFGDEAEQLRILGNEYGATTGRPRRVGWLDIPAMNYAIAKSGINALILTKFDILNGLDPIKICDSYKVNPVSSYDFTSTKPYFSEIPGWQDANTFAQISPFIEAIEKKTGLQVEYISRGTSEKDIISTLGR